jgi:hypothetical protein
MIIYSNNHFAQADCDKALDIEPNFVRALERRGNCYVIFQQLSFAAPDRIM